MEALDDDPLWSDIMSLLDAPSRPRDASPRNSRSECHAVSAPPSKDLKPRRRDRTAAKRTIEQLRSEAAQLATELEALRGRVSQARGSAMVTALDERAKRRRAEDECRQLRDALLAQTRFLRGLRSIFSTPLPFASKQNLCRHFHIYTRLPGDRATRRLEYASLAQGTRMGAATNMICRETDGPASIIPRVQAEALQTDAGFGITTMNVFAVDSDDVSVVLRATCVALRDILVLCEAYTCLNVQMKIVDPDATLLSTDASLIYRITDVHHRSKSDEDELSIQSQAVTLFKQTAEYAVMVWDYVDVDDMNPVNATADISRQSVGACLIRREQCDDGVHRLVFRSLSSRQYRFHARGSDGVLHRFQHVMENTMHANELLFRTILVNEVVKEQTALDSASVLMESQLR